MACNIFPYHIYLLRSRPPHVRPLRTGTVSPRANAMFRMIALRKTGKNRHIAPTQSSFSHCLSSVIYECN